MITQYLINTTTFKVCREVDKMCKLQLTSAKLLQMTWAGVLNVGVGMPYMEAGLLGCPHQLHTLCLFLYRLLIYKLLNMSRQNRECMIQ